MEDKVLIRCLQRDVGIIKSVIPDCVREYKRIIKTELGQDVQLDLSVDEQRPLEERKLPDFTGLKFEELTDDHERQIKIDKSIDTQRWYGLRV